MKTCTVCKENKEFILFYKDKRAKDGLYSCCKPCMDKKNAEWRLKNPEKIKKLSKLHHENNREKDRDRSREYARKLRKENYQKYRENKDNWDKNNPEKVKEIRKKALKKWTLKNPEKIKKINEEWLKKNPEKLKEYQRKAAKLSRIKFPEKNAARKMVSGAITLGLLIRPSTCSKCLIECKPEGHHPDYSKPLEVVWLCRQCHNKEHGK